MLFEFGKFWKSTIFLVFSWICYGIFGFEFTAITLLSLIIANNFTDTKRFI